MRRWVLRFVANPEAVLGMMHSGELNFISFYAGAPDLLLAEVKKDHQADRRLHRRAWLALPGHERAPASLR